MRICMVIPYDLSQEGGVKRHGFQLAAALRELGDAVEIVGPSRSPIAERHVTSLGGVVNVESNGSANHIGIFSSPLRVRRLLRERYFDVVHIHEPLVPSINYYAAWSAGRAALVGTFHAFAEQQTPRDRLVRRVWSSIAFPFYDRAIAVSPAAARLAAVTFDKPITVIPNGIVPELYTPGTVGSGLRLLFVGHWRDRRKGLPHLLSACAVLSQLGVRWSLDVVGDGGDVPRSTDPNVRYHGAISSEQQVASMYAACDVFVAPATGMESFGIVLLEAMASGRPIVCSDIEGYRYAAGDAAIFVPPGDPNALAHTLAGLDVGTRKRLAAAGRARVRDFAWDRLALRVRDEYVAAIADAPRAVAR